MLREAFLIPYSHGPWRECLLQVDSMQKRASSYFGRRFTLAGITDRMTKAFDRVRDSAETSVKRRSRRRRNIWVALKQSRTITVSALLLGACFFGYFACSHAASRSGFDQITVSMTQEDVQRLLGIPHWIFPSDPPDPAVTTFSYGGFPRFKWCTMDVYFDADGRVIRKFHDH